MLPPQDRLGFCRFRLLYRIVDRGRRIKPPAPGHVGEYRSFGHGLMVSQLHAPARLFMLLAPLAV